MNKPDYLALLHIGFLGCVCVPLKGYTLVSEIER